MSYFLLALSTLSSTGKALFCKLVKTNSSPKESFAVNGKAFFVAFLCTVAFNIENLLKGVSLSVFSFVLSFAYALSLFLTQFMQIKALASGPVSLSTLLYSFGFLPPIFYSAIFLNESVSLLQWLGILLLFPALYLIIHKKDGGRVALKWLFYALLSALLSGTTAILQKTHQLSVYAKELPIFLLFAFFFSACFSVCGIFIFRKAKPIQSTTSTTLDKFSPYLLGLFVGALNFLNLTLAGKIPAIVLFPVYNVGSLILTSVLSLLLFREKTTRRQFYGFCIGVIAILIIGLF